MTCQSTRRFSKFLTNNSIYTNELKLFLSSRKLEPAGGFYLEGGAEGTDSLTNNSFMCVLNTLLRMTINSDNMCSTLGDIQPSLSLWALTHHKNDLIAYISKQGVPEKEISTCIFRSLCLTYGANRDIPELF